MVKRSLFLFFYYFKTYEFNGAKGETLFQNKLAVKSRRDEFPSRLILTPLHK